MLLRQALAAAVKARISSSKNLALVCSFEPLHLKTYLQAFLSQQAPDETPNLITFGFDQLHEALARTSSQLKTAPVLLVLSWEDLHPALTWRTRGGLSDVTADDIREQGRGLKNRLHNWILSRPGETYFAVPPIEWLPLLDHQPAHSLGPASIAASAIMWELADMLASAGGRQLRFGPVDLNFRDLLQAGHPFPLEACETLAGRLTAAAFPQTSRKKVLTVDLDGTLWKGSIGEGGRDSLSHRPEGSGYPFHVFQKFLKKLKNEGALLAFCSKNNPQDVLPVFDALDMPLKLSDFAAFRCNWDAKSKNIRAIAQELNLGCDALVFVDDNEAELAEIRQNAPNVIVLRTPTEGKDWLRLMFELQTLFGTWRISAEDRGRLASFSKEHRFTAANDFAAAPEKAEHLREFQLEITISQDAFSDPRSLELINKTNQFNLTGEKLTLEEWLAWASTPGAFCLSARLRDRFGDFGTVGVITGRVDEFQKIFVRQFVLSCRAFGRGVETALFGELAQRHPAEWIYGSFLQNGKNDPAQRFLAGFGRKLPEDGQWKIPREAAIQASLEIIEQSKAVVIRK